jgi:hypothetical protein
VWEAPIERSAPTRALTDTEEGAMSAVSSARERCTRKSSDAGSAMRSARCLACPRLRLRNAKVNVCCGLGVKLGRELASVTTVQSSANDSEEACAPMTRSASMASMLTCRTPVERKRIITARRCGKKKERKRRNGENERRDSTGKRENH